MRLFTAEELEEEEPGEAECLPTGVQAKEKSRLRWCEHRKRQVYDDKLILAKIGG